MRRQVSIFVNNIDVFVKRQCVTAPISDAMRTPKKPSKCVWGGGGGVGRGVRRVGR